ncbi:MAG: acyl-CoA dehydrogenase N-terminal domain-containing protein [Bacteroidota bacterium]
MDTLRFQLFHTHDVEEVFSFDRFADHDK